MADCQQKEQCQGRLFCKWFTFFMWSHINGQKHESPFTLPNSSKFDHNGQRIVLCIKFNFSSFLFQTRANFKIQLNNVIYLSDTVSQTLYVAIHYAQCEYPFIIDHRLCLIGTSNSILLTPCHQIHLLFSLLTEL